MKLFIKSLLFCLLLKQVVANGCALATSFQQYQNVTCKLPQNFSLFDEQEFPKNHFRCPQEAELWVICADGQLREFVTNGETLYATSDGFDEVGNEFTVTVNRYLLYAMSILIGILLLTSWIALAVIMIVFKKFTK